MVKVTMTGAQAPPATPRGLAAARLQALRGSGGDYGAVSLKPSTDTTSFGVRAEATQQQQTTTTRWQNLNDAAKRTTKIGAVFAGSLIGGIFGGFPGMLMGALLVGALLSLRNVLRGRTPQAPEKPAEVPAKPLKANPFNMALSQPVVEAEETATPRELASERLQALRQFDSIEGPEPQPAAVPAKKAGASAQIRFNGNMLTVRNLVPGMMPESFNPFSGVPPTLKFRMANLIRKSELASDKAGVFYSAAAHNAVEPMTVVTLGKAHSKTHLFDPRRQEQGIVSRIESVFWGGEDVI